MKSLSLLVLLLACVFFVSACAVQRPPEPKWKTQLARVRTKEHLNILFIGNSYSFELPRELGKILHAQGKAWHVERVGHSGWSLRRHVAKREAIAAIRSRKWDVVVLQEQSLIPASRLKVRAFMLSAANTLVSEIEAQGALPVLCQTWGRKAKFGWQNAKVRDGIHFAAEQLGGLPVVPVGDVWEKEMQAGRADDLYHPDGSHPSQEGSRIAARVIYDFLTKG